MVIPLGDEPSGSRTPPYVIYALIAINTLVWLYQLQAGESFTNGWSTVPYEITHGKDLVGAQTVHVGGEAFPVQLYPGPTPIYLTLLSATSSQNDELKDVWNSVTNLPSRSTNPSAQTVRTSLSSCLAFSMM